MIMIINQADSRHRENKKSSEVDDDSVEITLFALFIVDNSNVG